MSDQEGGLYLGLFHEIDTNYYLQTFSKLGYLG